MKAAPCRMVLVTVDPHSNNGADHAPAVIVRAWSDEMVNVRVFQDGPNVPWMTSVPLFADREALEAERSKRIADGMIPGGMVWHAAYWPPQTDPAAGVPRRPGLCEVVQYRGKQGYQALRSAIVTATADSLDPRGVEAGDVAALDSPTHVHLWVFDLGERGGFPESNVALDDPGMCRPGMWQWPSGV